LSVDHVGVRVADFDASRTFYTIVLAPLGVSELFVDEQRGVALWPGFAIISDGERRSRDVHVAFAAATNAEVDAFWQAGIDAGYGDNGAPGERAIYHPGYYGAFLFDPDGNNVEAVCHNR
jgi:catechol 2,3-dioxygenase-like lactoylglutathione lyase family enzyme